MHDRQRCLHSTVVAQRERFEALAGRIEPGSTLLRTWELKGGVSAQVTAFEIERPNGRTERLIVRRHGAADLKRNPHIARVPYDYGASARRISLRGTKLMRPPLL
jgi:hypothetical protein